MAYPARFDFLFVYWYLMRFVGEGPLRHSALDVETFAMALLKKDYRESPHTHVALDDAVEWGALFCDKLRQKRSSRA